MPTVAKPEQVHDLYQRADASGAAEMPLFLGAWLGRIALHIIGRNWDRFYPDEGCDVPEVALIGDVDRSTGPKFWNATASIKRWRPEVMIVVCRETVIEDYAAIFLEISQYDRAVIVETEPKFTDEWSRALRPKASFIMRGTLH